jgi:hypothetical protein
VALRPTKSKSLVFKMPIVPLPADSQEARQVADVNYSLSFQRMASTWEALLSKGGLKFPEAKVQECLFANTAREQVPAGAGTDSDLRAVVL